MMALACVSLSGMLRGMGDDEAACYSRLSVLSDIFVFPN
jgi:hypothetical protein